MKIGVKKWEQSANSNAKYKDNDENVFHGCNCFNFCAVLTLQPIAFIRNLHILGNI